MATKEKKADSPEDVAGLESPDREAESPPDTPEAPEPTMPPTPPTQPSKKPEKPSVQDGGFCVYLGPSILGVISGGKVYKDDKATTAVMLAPVIGKYPLIASLIVHGADLPKSRLEIKQPGSLLYANYSKLAGIIKKSKEG